MQEESFRDHFFFGKMDVVRMKPLTAQELVSVYLQIFKRTDPFTEEAILQLAKLSRETFRRFLQYIKLCLDKQREDGGQRGLIDEDLVKKAISREQLAEDMELELRELFPKQADLRLQTIQILTHLQTTGPKLQSQLARDLEMKPYAVSRLLTRLEHHRHITRQRAGSDKMVSLTNKQPEPSTDPRHTPSLLPN